jgi:hypothetical protein
VSQMVSASGAWFFGVPFLFPRMRDSFANRRIA